jgi:hypothetical protein
VEFYTEEKYFAYKVYEDKRGEEIISINIVFADDETCYSNPKTMLLRKV